MLASTAMEGPCYSMQLVARKFDGSDTCDSLGYGRQCVLVHLSDGGHNQRLVLLSMAQVHT